ncbi:MAG: glutaredoxin family protein [Microbacterium sp.]
MTALTLIAKPDCHLCDVAREVVDQTIAELPEDVSARIEVTERSILDDAGLHETWWERIPVVLIDGDLHAHWRVSPGRLRDALAAAAGGSDADDRAADQARSADPRRVP